MPRASSWDLGTGCEAGSPVPKGLPVLLGFFRHSGQKHGPRFGDVRGLGGNGFEREGGQVVKVQMRPLLWAQVGRGQQALHGHAQSRSLCGWWQLELRATGAGTSEAGPSPHGRECSEGCRGALSPASGALLPGRAGPIWSLVGSVPAGAEPFIAGERRAICEGPTRTLRPSGAGALVWGPAWDPGGRKRDCPAAPVGLLAFPLRL